MKTKLDNLGFGVTQMRIAKVALGLEIVVRDSWSTHTKRKFGYGFAAALKCLFDKNTWSALGVFRGSLGVTRVTPQNLRGHKFRT